MVKKNEFVLTLLIIFLITPCLFGLELVHEELIGGVYEDVVIYDDYLYAATHYGIHSFDISDPEQIIPLEHQKYQGVKFVMLMDSNLVAIGESPNRVLTFSLQNPESPELLSQVQTGDFRAEPTICNNFLYGPAQYRGVRVVSLQDPDNLEYVGDMTEDISFAAEVYTYERHLYVLDMLQRSIIVYSLDNPENPQRLTTLNPDHPIRNMSIGSGHLYCNSRFGDLSIFSLEEPEDPEFITHYTFEAHFLYNQIVVDQLWLITNPDIYVFNLDNPAEPELIEIREDFGLVRGCAWNEENLAIGYWNGCGFELWRQDNFEKVSEFWNEGGVNFIALNDPFIYTINSIQTSRNYYQRIYTIEQSGISETNITDSLTIINAPMLMNMQYYQDFLYCLFVDSLRIFDCSNPGHPTFVKSYREPEGRGGRYRGFSMINGLLLTYQNGILRLNSLEDPVNPEEISTYESERDMQCPSYNEAVGDIIYIKSSENNWDRFLEVISIEDPFNPVLVNEVEVEEYFFHHNGVKCGNYFIIGNQTGNKYYIFDISNPVHPNLVYETSGAGGWGITANDSMFVVSDYLGMTSVYSLNNEGIPQLFARSKYGNGFYKFTNDQLLCGSNISLMFFDLEPTSVKGDNKTPILNDHILISNFPNPFNATTNISFNINARGHVQLGIFNMTGRKVSDLLDTDLESGNYNFLWDAAGLASGPYQCQMMVGGQVFTQKLMLVK